MKGILKNVGVLILVLILTYFLGKFFYKIPGSYTQNYDGGFFGYGAIGVAVIGLFHAYTFFLSLLFSAFGDKYKYWWMGILLLPVLWFIIKLDLVHWYFYAVLAILGWFVGWSVHRFISKKA